MRSDVDTPATVSVVTATPLVGKGGISGVHAALVKINERPCARPERVFTAVAGVGGLSGNWWPGPTVGWTMAR